MRKVGFIFGEIRDTGSTWNYITTLAHKIDATEGYSAVGLYHTGNPDDFDFAIECIEYPKQVVSWWDSVVHDNDIDLVHRDGQPLLNHIPAVRSPVPVVSTIHGAWNCPWDERLRLQERGVSKFQFECYRIIERLSRYSYDQLFTVSDHVAEAVIRRANIPEEKVMTIYNPIDEEFFSEPRQNPPNGAPERYLFHVSHANPRKNVSSIVRSLKQLDDDIPLFIAGSGWEDQIGQLVVNLGLDDRVNFLGYLELSDLIRWMEHASVFVFPSRYETFGLPNIETMARGTPVITSKRGGIPEVVGDSAYLLGDPENPLEIAEAINRVLADQDLYDDLKYNGLDRAERYQWGSHLDEVIVQYENII